MDKEICEKLGIVIEEPDQRAMETAGKNWNTVCKPLGSLGLLEEAVIKMAGIFKTDKIVLKKRCTVVVCSDNGVIAEGVTQSDKDVTVSVAKSIADGKANINVMGGAANVDTFAVDVGIDGDIDDNRIINRKIAYGTCNIAVGPAMTYEQAMQGIKVGIELVKMMKEKGYQIITTGEMGIGNTTTSSAIASVLLGKTVEDVTGKGAGLSSDGLKRKIQVIKQAIAVNHPVQDHAVDVLSKLGGYDIAAMTGIFLGGGAYRIPIVIDGVISSIAALLSQMIAPVSREYMFASHVSEEPAGILLMERLKLNPLIYGHMRLGEGTGGVCLLPLFDIALAEYHGAHRFTDTDIDQYKELK